MIKRAPEYYTTGFGGKDARKAPFYERALVFDGGEGAYNRKMIESFNEYIEKENLFDHKLKISIDKNNSYPSKIAVINASHDDLPTSYETARVFEDYCRKKRFSIKIKVVNTREELFDFVGMDLGHLLVMSQCVDKNVYNVSFAEELQNRGAVIVPGKITAPGSIFSDKDSTYKMLSDCGRDWTRVARYKKIAVEGKDTAQVVDEILGAVDLLRDEIGETTFFVKPHEGGGGLGGFRITIYGDGYIIPDLSKVHGDNSDIHPTYIDIDVGDENKLREILWIYRLFSSDEKLSSNYLKIKLPIKNGRYGDDINELKNYINSSALKRKDKLKNMVLSKEEVSRELCKAIDIFEKKIGRRYVPLVNEHIDFGLWGLRAHYRFSRKGPVLETMYHRIFQLGFTEEGIGYMGADNISNKQTGDLEIMRLGPLNEILVDAIGGERALFRTLEKGAEALIRLAEQASLQERDKIPIRVQIDLAAVSKRIGEGNADTARGLCLASNWAKFVYNACEWLEDSLLYYSWSKDGGVK